MNWIIWILVAGPLQMCLLVQTDWSFDKLKECLKKETKHLVVADSLNGVIHQHIWNSSTPCIIFLQKTGTAGEEQPDKQWPQLHDDTLLLEKRHISTPSMLYFLDGECKNISDFTESGCSNIWNSTGECNFTCIQPKTMCHEVSYGECTKPGECGFTCIQTKTMCDEVSHGECTTPGLEYKNKYIIKYIHESESVLCINCDNPVKKPDEEIKQEDLQREFNITIDIGEEKDIDPRQAADVMNKMSDLACCINGPSVLLDMGDKAKGVMVRHEDPKEVEEVSFAFSSPNDSFNIIEEESKLPSFARSLTVPKQAFDRAISMNLTVPFAAVFRFLNMANDSLNSSLLHNEVLAIEMGTLISNLTDRISINYRHMKYEGTPLCRSWNGEGGRPNWTDKGCETIINGDNITCECSHLTFFAVLLAGPNQTISSYDLKTLTSITQVGCGLSMFFLAIVLLMHFLLRKTEASKATRILINLVSSMFLLNLTFLINNFVAKMKNDVGCKIIALLTHYFMLTTFNWFAAQAFHICLQLYTGGKITIRHYILKVCIISWVLPSIVGIVLLVLGKYGEELIHTTDTYENVAMCWISDIYVHYIVNIGYYALVFIFTVTTFIIILSWLFCSNITKMADVQSASSGQKIVTIMGLCCMLGISWGFAFFAHGAFLMPAYYIFTILNSFQGFFLFIYYHRTSRSGAQQGGGDTSISSNGTLKSNLDLFNNPYIDTANQKSTK